MCDTVMGPKLLLNLHNGADNKDTITIASGVDLDHGAHYASAIGETVEFYLENLILARWSQFVTTSSFSSLVNPEGKAVK